MAEIQFDLALSANVVRRRHHAFVVLGGFHRGRTAEVLGFVLGLEFFEVVPGPFLPVMSQVPRPADMAPIHRQKLVEGLAVAGLGSGQGMVSDLTAAAPAAKMAF